MRINQQTRRCVRCLKIATLWCGWVEGSKGRHVLAGWCSHRCLNVWRTCHGRLNRRMQAESAE